MKEQELIIDLYTSIPIKFNDKAKWGTNKCENITTVQILDELNKRTQIETGVPIKSWEYRNLDINRFFLENVQIILYENLITVALLISIDTKTRCGVLHLIALSCNLHITSYLDSVSLNQLNVQQENGQVENLFYYLKRVYEIEKKGVSKNFLTIGNNRNNITDDLLASILFCETHYEENESLSTVTDKDIEKILSDKNGGGQYKYAIVYAYRNILVQMIDEHYQDRKLEMECVTLFYIELILFEEATIEKANDEIIPFLENINKFRPKEILQIINSILSEHVKSINFWNIQMSYPSSQKSIDYIRSAFNIEKKRTTFQRNQKELLMIYNIRSDMVDKEESKFITIIAAIFTIIATAFTAISALDSPFNCKNLTVIISICISSILFLIMYRKYMQRKLRSKERFIKKLLEKTKR